MEEENRKETIEIVRELNELGNQLTLNVDELLKEVDSYKDKYYDQIFVPNEIKNDRDGNLTRKEIKRGETYFDKIHESMLRNDFIYHFQEIVELILQKFTKKMKQLKEGINEERERLINANNQTINSLEQ